MSVIPSRPSIRNAFSRSASIFRRAQRNRRRSALEVLEGRVVPSYVLSYNSGTNAATAVQSANTGNAGDSLAIEQVPGTGLEWSVNNSAFSDVWAGGTSPNTPPNTSAVTVTITQVALATNNTITLGNPSSPISSMNSAFVIAGTPASSSLSIDDSTGTAATNTYTFNGSLFSNTGSTFTTTISSGTVENNTITINGSSVADTYDVEGSLTGQPVDFFGGVGANTVNVGSTPGNLATSSLSTIASTVTFADTLTGGTATVNVNDQGSTTSAPGLLSFVNPFELVSGFGFGTGGSLYFNAPTSTGAPGTTSLNVFPGSSAGGTAGVTTNVVSTPSTLSTKITGGSNTNTYNIGGAAPGALSNVAGAVNVVGNGGGTSAIDLNDQSSTAGPTYAVNSSTVTSTGAFGGLTYSGVGFLTLNAGSGTSTVNVSSTLLNSTTNINGDNGSGTINVNGTGTGGTLNVATGTAGGSTVNVVADSEPVNVTTNGTPTFDTVNIGAAGGTGNLPGITGLVTVTGNTSYALAINDQGDASAQTYNVNILNGGTNTGSAALGSTQFLSFHPSSIIPTATGTGLTFNGGGHGNTVNFNDLTPTGATTNIFAGAGSDTTTLRGSGSTSTVNIDSQAGTNSVTLGGNTVTPFPLGARWLLGSSVSVSDTGGTTAVTVDDSQDTTARTVSMSGSSITGLAPATINFTAPGVNVLTVNGGSGGNTFTISGTLANSVAPFETLNKGSGANNTVNVFATSAGGPLTLTGTGTPDTVTIGQDGSVAGILGPVNINESPGSTALTIDLSNDDLPHTLNLSSNGTTSTLHDMLGNLPSDITYVTTSLASLTINADGSASQTLNLNFGGGGNPIPTASSPGLVFNAGNPAAGVSSALNIFGQLPSGAFQTETHNANDQTVFPQVGQYGSIFFVDGDGFGTSLDYTGLQPINDTTPATVYTFNDFGYPDQSFLAQVGPTVMGFATVQFANTPTPPTPLNFETTNIANKVNVTFNTPPMTAGVAGPAVSGVVNIPTASAGLASLTFDVPNDGNNNVSFLATPVTTSYNGDGANEATSVTGTGVATGTTLTVNGGPAINTLTYDAGGLVPQVTAITGGVAITIPGVAGTVDEFNYQQVNIVDVKSLTVTPTSNPISSVEGFNYVNIPVGSFTAPVPTIFSGLLAGALPVPTLPASSFTSTIDWGDPAGDDAAGTITQDAGNPSTYDITGTHTFAQAGTDTVTSTLNFAGGSITYPLSVPLGTSPASTTTIPVTVSFNAANGAPITSSNTATVTQGPVAVTVFPAVGTEGLDIGPGLVATFVDAGGANPEGDYSAAVSIVSSDGTVITPTGPFTVAQVGSSAQYTVTGDLGIVPEEGVYTVLVSITDDSTGTPLVFTGGGTATIADAPLSAGVSAILTPDTGVAFPATTVVGTFLDANPTGPLSDFTATIDWGDGTPISQGTIVQPGGVGTAFEVEGGHTYAAFGTYTITTVVNDVGGSTVTLLAGSTVTDLAPSGTYQDFTAQEGLDTGTIVLGTVTDPDTLATTADLSATVDWGDGTTSPVSVRVVPSGGTATDTVFQLVGDHTYAEEGTYTYTLTATTPGGVATTFPVAGGTATVNDAPLTASGSISITGVEGASTGTKVIATFTDANPGATLSDFSGTVNWGDPGGTLPLDPSDFSEVGTANGVLFIVSAAHTYLEEGSYQITVAINDVGGASTVAHASAVIADAPLTAPAQTPIVASTGIAIPAGTVVGTFTDANPNATVSDFTATIDWGDGTPISQGTIVQPGGVGTAFEVEGGHTYAAQGTYTITTVVTDVGGSVVTITNTATVTDVAPTGTYVNFTAQEGQSTGTIVLATITDPDTLATVADLSAMLVTWGDGTPATPVTIAVVPTGGTATDTTFELLGSHTYHEEGTYTFTITAATPGGVAVAFTPAAGGTATVNDAPLSSSGSISITDVEGDPTPPSKLIATFTDANPFATVADFTTGGGSVVVNWGDGSTPQTLPASAITSSGLANGVLFSVTAAHTFDEEGSYQITVTATDDGGSTTIAHASAVIADAPLTAGPAVALTPNTGVLLSGVTVATFTDANPTAPVSDFTATIDWGDGTPTTLGTIVQPGGVGTAFDVEGTHAYSKPGTYITKVVVTDVGGSVVSIPGTATVTDPALSGTADSFTAVEGQTTGTILLATIDNPNTLAGVSQLTATVNWGDSATDFVVPLSLVGGTPSESIFQINSSHTYAEEGTYTVSVLVTTTGGATTAPDSPLTATATVVDAPLVSVGSESISGIEGITTGPKLIATWTDTNPGATVADYTTGGGSVVVNWGDGTAPVTLPASAITATGSPNGVVFNATFAHTYAEEGSYQVTTTIDDAGGSTSVAHGFAVIADAPLTAGPTFEATTDINATTAAIDNGVITETLPFTTVVATFTDANPLAPISDYSYVTINWGDGSPSTAGTVIQPGGVGTTFEVLGTHTYTGGAFSANGGSLDFPTTINIQDEGGSKLTINNSVTVAEVNFAITGQLNPASDSGQSNLDAITDVTQPNFFGTAIYTLPNGQVVPAPGAQITLYATPVLGTPGSQFSIGTTTANGAGAWSITSTVPLAQGTYVISASGVNAEGVEGDEITILPNASQGLLTIDTAGPKVTALTFDRVDGQIDLTFQDNLSGMDQAEVANAANYQLTKLHTRLGTYKVNVISATPDGPTGLENVVLSINDGRQLRGGIYTFTVFSGSGATGIRDVAGNALDGEFYGYFPSGNNIPGGNFVAGLNAVHHTIFAPQTLVGHATPVSPPGTPATGTTIPTANPQLPSGNPNFHGNPSLLKGAKVHHRVLVTHPIKKTSAPKPTTTAHDLALEHFMGGIES